MASLMQRFTHRTKATATTSRGRTSASWTDDPIKMIGFITNTRPGRVARAGQDQHPTTVNIAIRGPQTLRVGDYLGLNTRTFLIQTANDKADLGLWTIYTCTERLDV